MKKWTFFLTGFTLIFLLAACGNEAQESTKENEQKNVSANTEQVIKNESASLQLLENEKIGKYLADSNGMTLYYFTKDQSGKSNCSGECLANWPAFSAEGFEVPEEFNKNDFSTIKREDNGVEQVTYKGYPLYYFINDKARGDVNGQGLKDVWYIINTETSL